MRPSPTRASYLAGPLPIETELSELFDSDEELTIFEVGACEGLDTVRYARRFPQSTVFAFEPVPDNVALLRERLNICSISNAEAIEVAVSDTEGSATLHVSSTAEGHERSGDWDLGNKSSSLLTPTRHLDRYEFVSFDRRIEVPCTTLHRFASDRGIDRIDFVHMDVQGAELRVLEGAGDLLLKTGAIWLEVSKVELYDGQPLAKAIHTFMKKWGFRRYKRKMGSVQGDELYVNSRRFLISPFLKRVSRLEDVR